ncbi:MAG: YidC/Oxa1 family insertase periplasmic-domain containing protein [bacterium]
MDRRTLVALILMALVIVATPMLFPRRPAPATAVADSAATAPPSSNAAGASSAPAAPPTTGAPKVVNAQVSAPAGAGTPLARQTSSAPQNVELVALSTPRAEFTLTNPGAAPAKVTVSGYKDLRPGKRETMMITQSTGPLLHYRLALGADTIDLNTIRFAVQQTGSATTFTSTTPAITITYQAAPDGFRTNVVGTVAGAPAGSALLIDLPSELKSFEADTLDDQRHLAYGYRLPLRDVTSIPFGKLDPNVVRADTGVMQWVAARNKYWLVALMNPVPTPNLASAANTAGVFHGLTMTGGQRVGRVAPVARATTYELLTNGRFAFDLYVGPQSWQDLHAFGNELENVNPYAGWLRKVVQPFGTIVMRVLLWMKATLRVNYGWVLVLFGVVIRMLLWPLNQKAMRTSMAMQRLQPELAELQKRYKNDPDKQRDALVKLYKDHNMSPLSPMLGCLPMLLPMPVLFALYFVFQNTIEFRGVQFLWLPDISLRDPFYIIPVVMGASMFLLSWIGMRGMPPNPQTKMMSYMMPVMFTVMFLNFASGLNLYYAVQNIAALPQQWIISRERARAGTGTASATGGRKT